MGELNGKGTRGCGAGEHFSRCDIEEQWEWRVTSCGNSGGREENMGSPSLIYWKSKAEN